MDFELLKRFTTNEISIYDIGAWIYLYRTRYKLLTIIMDYNSAGYGNE